MRHFISILGIILLCSCSSETINDSSDNTNTQEIIVHSESYGEKIEDKYTTESIFSENINDSSSHTNTQEMIVHNESYEEKIEDGYNTEAVSSENINRPTLNMQAICLSTTFGPDACGFVAKKAFNEDAPDVLMSPACSLIISKLLSEDITTQDLKLSFITGALDGMSSHLLEKEGVMNIFGGIAMKGVSLGIKVNMYHDCIRKKLSE